jgi:hypothetical protein
MVMLSAIVALFVAVFTAFAREYFAKIKETRAEEQWGFTPEVKESNEGSDFNELEAKRKISAAQRKHPGESFSAKSTERDKAEAK